MARISARVPSGNRAIAAPAGLTTRGYLRILPLERIALLKVAAGSATAYPVVSRP
jgi:hypothetical protein